MQKYYGNYLGIVIHSGDPENRGRVKVFVPHVSATVYSEWNAIPEDKVFKFAGENASPDLEKIKTDLEKVLPWAEIAAPLIGGGTQGRYVAPQPTPSGAPAPVGPKNPGQPPKTGTTADGNFQIPSLEPIPSTNELLYGRSATQGLNMDGSLDTTDVEYFQKYPERGNAFYGADIFGKKHLPTTAGVAISRDQADTLFGGLSNAAKAGSLYVINPANCKFVKAPIMDVKNSPLKNKVAVEAHPDVHRAVGSDGSTKLMYSVSPPIEGNCADMTAQITGKPAQAIKEANPQDAFADTKNHPPIRANPGTDNYAANPYSNVTKGLFSTPNVGAHVWCFFDAGDPMRPVVFASAFGASDYDSVKQSSSFQSNSKPASNENPGDPNSGLTNDRYRGALVLNERGGTMEIINTEGIESMSFVNYHGNNIRMGEHMSVYAANNDQKLVACDQFLTVNNDRNVVVRNNYDLNVYGDIIRKTGHLNSYHKIYKQIIDKIKPIHDEHIAPFEIQRSEKGLRGSTTQKQSGTPAPCPVCNPGEEYNVVTSTPDSLSLNGMVLSLAPSTEKSPIVTKGTSSTQKKTAGTGGNIFGPPCLACGGSGKSPSSELGDWQKDSAKEKAAEKMVEQINELAELEAQLGPGGSEITTIAKDYTLTVGLVMNDMEAVRTDPKGKMVPNAMKIGTEGVYREKSEVPIMEIIPPHPAFPGGNFDLISMNRFNVMSGSGGIFFKTKGVVQLGGSLMNLNSDQILITSVNETKITAGKSFSIEAENINLAPKDGAQVMLDGGLAVARNAIIGGGLHVEGELSLHHITAPVEYQLTELEAPGAKTLSSKMIGIVRGVQAGSDDIVVWGNDVQGSIVVDAHHHTFKNLPLTLMNTSNDVRDAATANNTPDPKVTTTKYTVGSIGPNFPA